MTDHPAHDPDTGPKPRPLPLSEPTRSPAALRARAAGADEAVIDRLVHAFYDRARADTLLGPVFDARVANWPAHFRVMQDFWSTVVLGTGRYAGRPLEVHRRIDALSAAHFDRWVELWRRTVDDCVPVAARAGFVIPAERMAATMAARILQPPRSSPHERPN